MPCMESLTTLKQTTKVPHELSRVKRSAELQRSALICPLKTTLLPRARGQSSAIPPASSTPSSR